MHKGWWRRIRVITSLMRLLPGLLRVVILALFLFAFFSLRIRICRNRLFCTSQLVPAKDSAVDKKQLLQTVIGRQRPTDMREKHDKYNERKFDDRGGGIGKKTLFQMLDKLRLQYEMQVGWL